MPTVIYFFIFDQNKYYPFLNVDSFLVLIEAKSIHTFTWEADKWDASQCFLKGLTLWLNLDHIFKYVCAFYWIQVVNHADFFIPNSQQ